MSKDSGIKGKIIDSSTGKPLAGANVILDNTMKGSATDVKGILNINNIKTGTYTIKVS